MPLDFSRQEVPVFAPPITRKAISRKAVILDKIINYFDEHPSHWTQGSIKKGDAFCIVGAVQNFTTFWERPAIYSLIFGALPARYQYGWLLRTSIVAFNDHGITTRWSVLRVLREARANA